MEGREGGRKKGRKEKKRGEERKGREEERGKGKTQGRREGWKGGKEGEKLVLLSRLQGELGPLGRAESLLGKACLLSAPLPSSHLPFFPVLVFRPPPSSFAFLLSFHLCLR